MQGDGKGGCMDVCLLYICTHTYTPHCSFACMYPNLNCTFSLLAQRKLGKNERSNKLVLGRLIDELTDWLADWLNWHPSTLPFCNCFIPFIFLPVYRELANPLLSILSFLTFTSSLALFSRKFHPFTFLPLSTCSTPTLSSHAIPFPFCGTMPLLRPSFHLQNSIEEKQYPNKDWVWGLKSMLICPTKTTRTPTR